MTLTKAELGDQLCTELGISKLLAKEFVEMTFEEIRQALEHGEEVKLSGLGNFKLRDKVPRPGRNPKTGEKKTIAARRVVTFTAGQKLKSKVDNYHTKSSSSEEQAKDA